MAVVKMNGFLGFWIFGAVLFQVGVNAKVNVTVFYESLCPDSMRFIRKQLNPTYKELGQFMNVELVPYGKAYYKTEPWRMYCQHGREECRGNAVQACAMSKLPENEMKVNFVSCVMSERYPPSAGATCARKLNYQYEGVEECSRSEEGRRLLMEAGNRTSAYKNILTFIPTIVFNEDFRERDQRSALYNLKSVICKKLEDPLPEECQN